MKAYERIDGDDDILKVLKADTTKWMDSAAWALAGIYGCGEHAWSCS